MKAALHYHLIVDDRLAESALCGSMLQVGSETNELQLLAAGVAPGKCVRCVNLVRRSGLNPGAITTCWAVRVMKPPKLDNLMGRTTGGMP